MVARTPPKQLRKLTVLAPLNPNLIRETVKKVDQCMARLEELQYTVTGGNKVVAGVSLSPRSTRAYLKTSIRCKQESIRGTASRKSPLRLHTKVPFTSEWRRMSLPAMLVGETIGEILRASKFAKEITQTVSQINTNPPPVSVDPITPIPTNRKLQRRTDPPIINPSPTLESRRRKEKQQRNLAPTQSESNATVTAPITSPLSLRRRRAKSRINFKTSSPPNPAANIMRESEENSSSMRANRVSPKHRPWAKKAVLFPNPLFNESSSNNVRRQRFCCKTKSPMIGRKIEQDEGNCCGTSTAITTPPVRNNTPHRFLIKSPPPSPKTRAKFQVRVKSPLKMTVSPTRAVVRTSSKFSPPRTVVRSGKFSPPRAVIKSSSKFSPPRAVVRTSSKFSPPRSVGGSTKRPSAASPLKVAASKLRRSLSPARLVNRLASPLRSRRSCGVVQRTVVVNGTKTVVAQPSMVGLKSVRM